MDFASTRLGLWSVKDTPTKKKQRIWWDSIGWLVVRSNHGSPWHVLITPVLTQLFFPKPPIAFLTCFCRGERQKYTEKKVRLNRGSNSHPSGHESNTLTTEPPGRGWWDSNLHVTFTTFYHGATQDPFSNDKLNPLLHRYSIWCNKSIWKHCEKRRKCS